MKRGFTLIELSIVLVIIGLIVGGVLIGQDLIKAADNRSVVTDFEKLQTAIYAFRNKYNGLPGDLETATNFWPTTVNGNGNGKIGDNVNDFTEMFRAMEQLGNAGLLPGTYTGLPGPLGAGDGVPGTNTLASKIPNAGFALRFYDAATLACCIGVQTFPNAAKSDSNAIVFGRQHDASYYPGSALFRPAIRAIDAYAIDSKMDDGAPGTGRLFSACPGITPNCATNCTSTATYDFSTNDVTCSFGYKASY
jgi:prepilin-type N-terminal cleavage/methylation domain-containing protein